MTPSTKRTLVVWLGSLGLLLVIKQIDTGLLKIGRQSALLDVLGALSLVVFIVLSLYWLAKGFRLLLRKLFWRVGRRLALSYFLIGVLPFVLFAILFIFVGYLVAGVLSQTAFRIEQNQTLTRLDEANVGHTLRGNLGTDLPKSLDVYDSAIPRKDKVPEWMLQQPFSGLVMRGNEAFFTSSRVYGRERKTRHVVLVLPLKGDWASGLEGRNGMMLSLHRAGEVEQKKIGLRPAGVHVQINRDQDYRVFGDEDIGRFLQRAWSPDRVIWFDVTPPLVDWESGRTDSNLRLFTMISNPLSNLRDFYFTSSDYFNGFVATIVTLAGMLLMIYLVASMFAAVLIFSISRAVNRIEKGTVAVERGDFTYRIKMRPHNQLGQMAQSFDRMTESIVSLLGRVAEKERLQSEIDIAATIQRNLLPKEGPSFHGVSFSAHFEPSAAIGGDYYDVFNLDRTRLAVAIGDVSGHGLSTGLVMAMVKAAMTTLVEEGADEEALFRRLNDLVRRSTERRAFMTLGFTIFDLEQGTIRHTNAGHLYPYRLREGEPPMAIESPSMPLGLKEKITSRTVEIPLEQGDTLVYLSDGIIEAQNPEGDPFGFEKLEAILARLSDETPATVQMAILMAISEHSGDRPADDDRTVMVLRFDHLPGAGQQLVAASEVAV